jgi:hypothetical protein
MSTTSIVIIVSVVVILILMSTALLMRSKCKYSEVMGSWSGTEQFLTDGGLSEFHLYLTRDGLKAKGTLIMKKLDGEMISGQTMDIAGIPLYIPNDVNTEVTIKYEKNEVMPTKMMMVTDLSKGSMVLSVDDKVYADLTKN